MLDIKGVDAISDEKRGLLAIADKVIVIRPGALLQKAHLAVHVRFRSEVDMHRGVCPDHPSPG